MSTQSTIYESEQTLGRFLQLTRRYAIFHLIFFFLFLSELLALLLFLPFLAKSFWLATVVAATVLTVFSYFVLRFYFQTKKPEQFLALRENFVENCRRHDTFLPSVYQLIHRLEGQEYQYYRIPAHLDALAPLVQKFSVWCHFADVQLMKELLHIYCIRTQLAWIKSDPTDLELHRGLANSYVALSKMYQDPVKQGRSVFSFISREYTSPEMVLKFQKAALCAIEEFKIVLHYAPHDIRTLTALGAAYRDIDEKEEERKIYETVLQFSPHEKEIRFRLGTLYFQLGFMAHGLKIYEELYKTNDPKASELIQSYDEFHLS